MKVIIVGEWSYFAFSTGTLIRAKNKSKVVTDKACVKLLGISFSQKFIVRYILVLGISLPMWYGTFILVLESTTLRIENFQTATDFVFCRFKGKIIRQI